MTFKKNYKKLSRYGKKIINKLDGNNNTGSAKELVKKYLKLEEVEQAFIDKMYSYLAMEIDLIGGILEEWDLSIKGNNLKGSLVDQGLLKERKYISKLRYTIDDTLKEIYQEVLGYKNYLELSRADYNLMKSFLSEATN